MTYMLLLNCALKLVEEIILYHDARLKKHQNTNFNTNQNILSQLSLLITNSLPLSFKSQLLFNTNL